MKNTERQLLDWRQCRKCAFAGRDDADTATERVLKLVGNVSWAPVGTPRPGREIISNVPSEPLTATDICVGYGSPF